MDYLITGGNGFIGSNLIPYLLGRDEEATIINLDLARNTAMEDRMGFGQYHARYAFKEGDVCDLSSFEHYLKVCDAVINCSFENNIGTFRERMERFVRTNIIGSKLLADTAFKYGVPLMHVSTDQVYGSCPANVPRREEGSPMDPTNPYSVTMAAGERFVSLSARREGVPAAIIRPCELIGPNQGVSHLVPTTLRSIFEGRPPSVPGGGGERYRDWLHVLDLCSAMEMIMKSLTGSKTPVQAPPISMDAQHPGKTIISGTSVATAVKEPVMNIRPTPLVGGVTVYNITSELIATVPAMVRMVLELAGSDLPLRDTIDESFKDLGYNPSGRKLAYQGWQARYTDLTEVVRSTVQWYRDHPDRLQTTMSDRLMP